MRLIKSVCLVVLGFVVGIAATMAMPRIAAQAITEAPAVTQSGQPVGGQPVGTIVTGENIGFELIATGRHGEVAIGKLMIRVDDRWLPAASPVGLSPAR